MADEIVRDDYDMLALDAAEDKLAAAEAEAARWKAIATARSYPEQFVPGTGLYTAADGTVHDCPDGSVIANGKVCRLELGICPTCDGMGGEEDGAPAVINEFRPCPDCLRDRDGDPTGYTVETP